MRTYAERVGWQERLDDIPDCPVCEDEAVSSPPRSVLITDVDNTLLDWVAVWHASFSAMLSQLVELSGVPEDTLLAEIRAVHQRAGTSEYAFLIGELASLRQAAGNTPVLDFYDPAIQAFRAARNSSLRLYDDVSDFLSSLRMRGVLIIAYTESLSYYTEYRFRKLGLDEFVSTLYSPSDHSLPGGETRDSLRYYPDSHYQMKFTRHHYTPHGEYKPNPDILLSILRDAGASQEQAVYVGDSLVKDVWMAQQAGVLDAHAAYGETQNTGAYSLLRRASHWTDEDVDRERRSLHLRDIQPSINLDSCLSQLEDLVDFVPFERLA